MSKFPLILIIILLSVVVTLISGILLPTYLSRQILELRKEINSQNSNSKYSLQANTVPVTEKLIKSDISVSNRNVKTEDFGIVQNPISIQTPEKAKKRSKREAISGNDYVTWNFNFNLTEHRNRDLKESSEFNSGTSQKTKPLGIAIFTEGEAKRKTAFSDIEYSLKAVEYFFKYLLNAENYTLEETEADAVRSTDLPNLDAGSNAESPVKGREGKFFNLGSLNIFGFRRTPEKISSTSPKATDSAFERDELVTTEFPQTDVFIENSQEVLNLSSFQAQSLIAEKQSLVNVSNVSDSNLPGKTEDGECIDCDAESLETQINSNTANQTNDPIVIETTTKFTDEFLEMFCMSLVNKVGVSQHLSDSENIKENAADAHDVESSPENSLSDTLPTLISEKELNPELVAENSVLSNTLASESDRQKKFLSLSSIFGFGSGRAAEDEANELTSEKFANVDLSNLPTLIDCENYFRKKNVKMFSKPNLMDIISDPKIQFADFANATISSKIIEQQLHFLTDLIKTNLDNTIETFGKNSDGAITKSIFSETLEKDRSTLLEEMLLAESNDRIGNTKVSNMGTDINEDLTTELQRDGRFINIFGFGSGDGESRSHETIFGTDKSEFGSGDFRSFGAVDFGTNTNEFGSGGEILPRGKVFDRDINEKFGSGDSKSLRAALFGSNRDELGSGNLRSLEDTVFDIDRNKELGSGDPRSVGDTVFVTEINELESEDFRSSGNESFGNRNEFGSGESRSLESVDFDIEKNEFGSGDSFKETSDLYEEFKLNSTKKPANPSISQNLGSGDGRNLPENNEIFQNEKKCENNCTGTTGQLHDCDYDICNISYSEKDGNLLEVQNSVKESGCHGDCSKAIAVGNNETLGNFKFISSDDHVQVCPGCNDSLNNTDRSTNLIDVSECDKCNSSILISNIPTQNLQTEESLVTDTNQGKIDENFGTNVSAIRFDSSNDLTNKNNSEPNIHIGNESLHEQATERNAVRFLRPIFLTGSGDGGLFGDSGGPIILEEEEGTNTNTKENTNGDNMDSKMQNVIENTHDGHTTEKNTPMLLVPILLTSSGDGGLLEDSGRAVNLTEEETTVKSQNSTLRKAKLNDLLEFSEAVRESSMQKPNKERPVNGNVTAEKFTSPVAPSRRGRMEDEIDKQCDDCEYDYKDFIENYRKSQKSNHKSENITDHDRNKDANKFNKRTNTHSIEQIPVTNIIKIPATVSTDVNQSKKSIFPDLAKTRFQTRRCTAARDCDATLNERCVTINSLRVCGCSKGYARSIETNKCVVKKIVQTSIKLPSEHFEDDLKNPSSPSFHKKRKSSIELILLLLQHDPEMLKVLSEIDEIKFSNGSLIITLNLVFAAENQSEAELVKRLEDDLQIALHNETVLKSVSLNISDASLVSVNGEIDYCKFSELNYCSEHAYCVSNPALPASYACHCKEHFRDASFDPSHFGETCIAKCPKEYCGPYGHCELLANDEKMCLCSGLYFGRRCEVPGLYVLIMLGCVVFISITMLIVVVCKRRCSRFSYRESQARGSEENARNSNVNDKVSDAIALEDNIGTARFQSTTYTITTPAVKIIRPTVSESGSSYELESTFESSTVKPEEDTTV